MAGGLGAIRRGDGAGGSDEGADAALDASHVAPRGEEASVDDDGLAVVEGGAAVYAGVPVVGLDEVEDRDAFDVVGVPAPQCGDIVAETAQGAVEGDEGVRGVVRVRCGALVGAGLGGSGSNW